MIGKVLDEVVVEVGAHQVGAGCTERDVAAESVTGARAVRPARTSPTEPLVFLAAVHTRRRAVIVGDSVQSHVLGVRDTVPQPGHYMVNTFF